MKPNNFIWKSSTIQKYMEIINDIPILSEDEWQTLPFKINDPESKKRMVEGNLRSVLKFVVEMVKRYHISDEDFIMDLIQAGTLGLIIAINKFDASKGFKLNTYSRQWIYGELITTIKNHFSVYGNTVPHLSIEELTDKQHEEALLLYDDDEPYESTDNYLKERYLGRIILKNLTPQEAKIVRMTFYGATNKQKSYHIGLGKIRTKKILQKGMEKLKQASTGEQIARTQ